MNLFTAVGWPNGNSRLDSRGHLPHEVGQAQLLEVLIEVDARLEVEDAGDEALVHVDRSLTEQRPRIEVVEAEGLQIASTFFKKL